MKIGDLIKVVWIDIQSDSTWVEKWDLEPAICTTYGIFFGYDKGNLRMFASYNDTDMGDRIVIPKSLIKSKEVILKKVYEGKRTG